MGKYDEIIDENITGFIMPKDNIGEDFSMVYQEYKALKQEIAQYKKELNKFLKWGSEIETLFERIEKKLIR